MQGSSPDSTHSPGRSSRQDPGPSTRTPLAPDSSLDGSHEGTIPNLAGGTPRIGWRRRVLLLAAVIGCLTLFLLARVMANNPHVPAEWRVAESGRLQLVFSTAPALKDQLGAELVAAGPVEGPLAPFDGLTYAHSSRWIEDPVALRTLEGHRSTVAHAISEGQVHMVFADGQDLTVSTRPRGYAELGSMFWLLGAFSLVLFLVGWIMPLVQPRVGNLLYAVMAHAQAAQLLLAAISSVPALALPPALVGSEAALRTLFDALTGAAAVTATVWHPLRLPGRNAITLLVWGATLGYGAMSLGVPEFKGEWWWAQSLLLLQGVVCMGLLSWSHWLEPHPFTLIMRRFCLVTVGALSLLALAVSGIPHLPREVQPIAMAGQVIWTVFLASVIMLIPFVARSQQVMREFAMLAGISTLATSVDLLFIAVFSFSQFTSLTLSLFLALGAYAALRQWLVTQMMGARALTTERMFQHLYRIAREVEARPERAGERMIELLRHVFEPLEAVRAGGRGKISRIAGNGAVLLVPVPNLVDGPTTEGMVALRFAERGKRLFTPEDARLADRVVEQLMRALAHDRAVERGRSEERARIAQDLHDDIGARLLTLMYKAPSKEMEDYVRHTLQDLKTLTRGLAAKEHPLSLAAAEWKTDIGHRLSAARCELAWSFEADEDITLSMTQWSALTRILRELVSNIIAHSQARQVRIDALLQQGHFTLRILDDGVGHHPDAWSHGLGLGGIRKRVKLIGGTVSWSERQPRGILCKVDIPHLASSQPTA